MKIQWFPGHMTSALRTMETMIKAIDVVIYVLDARAPASCINPEFVALIGARPIIYILNKADLSNDNQNKKWQKKFSGEKSRCIILNSTENNSAKVLEKEIRDVNKEKIEKFARKGINVILRAMVLGVPNSGKSTLINNLCGKYKAITGDRPGVTRGKQWVRVSDNIELLDTPGTLWPSFENDNIAHNLAYIGSIKDEVLEQTDLAFDFIEKIVSIDKTIFEKRYNIIIDAKDETIDIFDKICEVRKFLIKRGQFDYERAARAIIDDFRKGKLGKITLDLL